MIIQTERIWLFEFAGSDPYFFGTYDGVACTMLDEDTIDLLDIQKVVFFIDIVGKGGITYRQSYGGEDVRMAESYGKSSEEYTLAFNVPLTQKKWLAKMIGRQFCVLAQRADLSFFTIFGQFEAEPLNIDNEVQQRVTLKSPRSNARQFEVISSNIQEIEETIDPSTATGFGFDYDFDFQLN